MAERWAAPTRRTELVKMAWQLSMYSLLLGLAAVVSLSISFVAWRRRKKQGSTMFLVLMLGASIWALGDTLQLSTTDLQLKLLFRTIGYVGHNIAPLGLLVFALSYTGHTHWITRRNVALLAAEPMAVALVVTPTNALGWHSLIWRTTSLGTVDQMVVLERSFGPWYWVNTAYNYTLVLISLYLFLYLALQSHSAARKQGLALIGGVIPPFFANVAWILGVSPIDFSPLAFTVTGLIFGVAIYRYRLFDIVPVARETVLDAMDNGYVVLDRNDNVTDINETARRHAAAVDDPIGRPVGEVLPTCLDLVREHRDSIENGSERSVTGEVTIEGASGEPLYFEVRISSIERAQFTGRLILLRNVTEQRTVEQWYQVLIENASDLVAVIDANGYYTYHSPSSARILGYEPGELVGRSVVPLIHPDDREAVLEKFERSVENPDYQPSHEFRFERSDGTWIWLESRGRNLLDHPVIEGVVVNSRDITDRKAHEGTLHQQNEQLQALASVAAHDLRNPLQVISGRLSLAQETGEDAHLELMEDAVDRMRTLVEDIVTIARQGELVGDPTPVDLAVLARETWEGIETKDARLVVEFESRRIVADRSKLRSLLENLFTNAITHCGPDVTVRVGATAGGFYVEDDGEGIPEEIRSEIFERGFSTERRGSGLGLAIVQSIVTAHGWNIALNDGSSGTRFDITDIDRIEGEPVESTHTD